MIDVQGPTVFKDNWIGIINGAATISALILSATLGLLIAPPDNLNDGENPWAPTAYCYSIAFSVGASMACIFTAYYLQIATSVCVREADFLRMMYHSGDFISVLLLVFFVISMFPLMVTTAAAWAPTELGVPITAETGRVTMALLFVPVLLLGGVVFLLIGPVGGVDFYWFRKGDVKDDTPDLDCVIEDFRFKVDRAKELRENFKRLSSARKEEARSAVTSNRVPVQSSVVQLTAGHPTTMQVHHLPGPPAAVEIAGHYANRR